MRFIIMGRSRSGTTLTHDILKDYGIPMDNLGGKSKEIESLDFEGGIKVSTPIIPMMDRLIKSDVKVIHIYRDGRDCVCSAMKKARDKGDNGTWRLKDPYAGSKSWADCLDRWKYLEERNDSADVLNVQFEDYISYPSCNSDLMSWFLGLDCDKLFKCEKKKVRKDMANIGRWKEELPDWEDVFHPNALKWLKVLGYV